MKSKFLFNVGDKIKDKDVNDNRTIEARVYNVDSEEFFYLLSNSAGYVDALSVKMVEKFFVLNNN